MALMELNEELTTSIDRNLVSVGVFIDLKKAFDTIDHSILLRKLEYYGVRGVALKWIHHYLKNRQQFVCYNNFKSDYKYIKCGVPQGSIVGPTLFLVYINDIVNISKKLKFILFADDTNIFYTGKTSQDVFHVLNCELLILSDWFKLNKLSLNISKTNYMVFKNCKNKFDGSISIDGVKVQRVNSTKFLGVIIDENLNWCEHIRNVELKVSRQLGILHKSGRVLDSKCLHTLYCSLILPQLSYCCEIWGNNYMSRLGNLVKLQKRAMRIIDSSDYRAHTNPIFIKYKRLKMVDIINLKTLVIVYKAKHNLLPANLQRLFHSVNDSHKYLTRSSTRGNFSKNYVRSALKSRCITFKGVQLWNDLQLNVNDIVSVRAFKNTVKEYFLMNYFNQN